MKQFFASTLSLLLTASAACAHDTWLQTNTNVTRIGDSTRIDFMLGNHGNAHRDFKLAGKADLAAGDASFAAPKAAPKKPLKVAVLLYDNMNLLDASGPLEVMQMANSIAPGSYQIFTVASRKAPIEVEGGALTMRPKYRLGESPVSDILIVPGGSMAALNAVENDATLMRWIAGRAARSRLTMSVCTGAFLLGKTGLLDGRRATTHWFTTEMFQRQFPKIKAMEGIRYVEDGKFITTAGVSSGLDGALYPVEKTAGKQVAETTARALQYRRNTAPFPAVPRRAVKVAAPSRAVTSGQLATNFDLECGMTVGEKPRFTRNIRGKLTAFARRNAAISSWHIPRIS